MRRYRDSGPPRKVRFRWDCRQTGGRGGGRIWCRRVVLTSTSRFSLYFRGVLWLLLWGLKVIFRLDEVLQKVRSNSGSSISKRHRSQPWLYELTLDTYKTTTHTQLIMAAALAIGLGIAVTAFLVCHIHLRPKPSVANKPLRSSPHIAYSLDHTVANIKDRAEQD